MILWPSERSTYHATCVKKVYRYLKNKCGEADFERKLVADRITDTFGYNKKLKTWYICEIKVNWSDLQKAAYQIHDTAFRFRKNHRGVTVVPVIAFPKRLYKELIKFDNWGSFCDICTTMSVAVWVIEQSTIREVVYPKINKPVKTTKSKATTTAKKKTTKTKKPKSKVEVSKTAKRKKSPVSTKRKTTTSRTHKSKSPRAKKHKK